MLGNLFNTRGISFQSIWGSGDELSFSTYAGVPIDENTSMRIAAFYTCVLLISDTISTLPVDAYIRRDGSRVPYRPKPQWVNKPDIEISRIDHYQQVLVSLLIDGNAFVRIYRDNRGEVVNLVAIDPQRVTIRRNPGSKKIEYVINGNSTANNSAPQPIGIVPAVDMLHIKELNRPGILRGVSRVQELKQQLGLSAALDEFAQRFFGQGATTQGVIEVPTTLTKEQAQDLKRSFYTPHSGVKNAHKVGVLFGGAQFKKTGVNPDEAQMIESRKLSIEEIARIFRVPPHMIGVTTPGAMSYASVEANAIQFVTHTLRPYVAKLEEAYSTLLPSEAFLKFNVDGLLRGDFTTRIQGYSVGLQSGFYSVNDVRRFEDLRPVDSGDTYRVPLANIDLGAANLVEQDKKIQMAQMLIQSGFDPASVMKALELPAINHTGVPSAQLQPISQIDPANPSAAYGVK
jgi:HK97 family phage portal protein